MDTDAQTIAHTAFVCQPDRNVDAALLPELDAAVTFLHEEIAQLERGELDGRLLELLAAPPVPRDTCAALLQVWDVPAVPTDLTALAERLAQLQTRSNSHHDLTAESNDDEAGDDDDDDDDSGEAELQRPRRARSQQPVAAARAVTVVDSDDSNDANVDAIDLTGSAESESDDASRRTMKAPRATTATTANGEKEDEGGGAGSSPREAAGGAQTALRTLRTSMLLDVLSKIRSVAKTKGVDPTSQTTAAALDVLDLDGIAAAVTRSEIAEWDDFAHHVYLFCQLVIADSDAHGQLEAKQKGVELLHFARTLTETLRKASAAKEDALRQQLGGSAAPLAISSQQSDRGAAAAALAMMHTTKSSPLPPAHASPLAKRQSTDALTPNRISARIRQRASSFSDLPAPIGSGGVDDAPGDATDDVGTESRRSKRPRTASNASTVATPPLSTIATATTTASDDDGEHQSESESQVSAASEAESQQSKRRASRARDTAATASSAPPSAQTTPVTRTRTRTRRPVLPATRVSSRQQKRRAQRAQAASATDNDDNGSDTPAAAAHGGGDDDNDTAQGEDDDDDHASDSAAHGGDAETDAAPAAPPVLLTKSGRPRKKPGRKPAGWKKSESK